MSGFCKLQAEIMKMSTFISLLTLRDREIMLHQDIPPPPLST